jgi:hypothetical protein
MSLAGEGAAVRKLEVRLRPLERLDVRLLGDGQHERVVGRFETKPGPRA